MSHITFITTGTRGDVEPFINFALSLKKMGHTIRVAAPPDFEEWILSLELEYAQIGLKPIKTLLEATQKEDLLNFNIFKIRKVINFFKQHIRDVLITTLPHVADGTDLIISHVALPASSELAEAKDVPLIFVSTVPLAPSKERPSIIMPENFEPFRGRFYNQLTHLPTRFSRLFYTGVYKELRKKLNLPKNSIFTEAFQKAGTPVPLLHIYSKHLHSRPKDWPENAQIIGFSFNDHEAMNWQPPQELVNFLENGPPPIYIGFGSMIPRDEKELTNTICKAVEKANVRALISKGWAELTPASKSENILPIGPTPHHRLFPYCKAVVHHGGAGTTAAGLRAGCPTLICPFGFDQPFWGKIIFDRGLGPQPIKLKDLSIDNLSNALKQLNTSTEYKNNSNRIALKLNQEDAFQNLTPYIETALNQPIKQKIQVE